MRSFGEGFHRATRLPHELAQTLRLLGESKGKEEVFERRTPEVLETLRRAALIESTESSNRIEGIVASHQRIRELVEGDSPPRNRSEQEIAGYRAVLGRIHSDHEHMPWTPNVVLQLHGEMYRFLPQEGGRYKSVDNEITETAADGSRRVRFRPVSAFETPRAMEELHRLYRLRRAEGQIEPLLLLASYVLDFLCIHPFLDGNGRLGRLLTLLGLYREGYGVGRFVSLERIVETHRESYYESLQASSAGWHGAEHDPVPWWEFFLGVMMLHAYEAFEVEAEKIKDQPGAKSRRVREAVRRMPETFAIRNVLDATIGVSRPTVERVLREMRDAGDIRSLGRGRTARWEKCGPGARPRDGGDEVSA